MSEEKNDPTLLLLLTVFPNFKDGLYQIYSQDDIFREIASEYKECIDKQEVIFKETGNRSDLFSETISELKEELITHLASISK